jgi:hypothetical protein
MIRTAALSVMVLAAGSTVSADVLWSQQPINTFSGLASQDARNPGGLGWFAEVVDNFTAADGWMINGVEFWGGYPQVAPGHTQGFTIRVYADNGGQVGTLLMMQDVMMFSEVQYYEHPTLHFPGYHYTLTLPATFAVPGAGSYWMSVVAILDRGGTSTEPQWGWAAATTVTPPFCKQWFFSPGNFIDQTNDEAFVLNGTVGGACYANCDASTTAPILNVNDFICFQTQFAAGASYANCDGSTAPPVLNVNDFICFQTRFAAGCP